MCVEFHPLALPHSQSKLLYFNTLRGQMQLRRLTRILRGSPLRKTRFHDEKGNPVDPDGDVVLTLDDGTVAKLPVTP